MKKQYFTPAVKVHTLLVETPILVTTNGKDAAIGTKVDPNTGQTKQDEADVDKPLPDLEGPGIGNI